MKLIGLFWVVGISRPPSSFSLYDWHHFCLKLNTCPPWWMTAVKPSAPFNFFPPQGSADPRAGSQELFTYQFLLQSFTTLQGREKTPIICGWVSDMRVLRISTPLLFGNPNLHLVISLHTWIFTNTSEIPFFYVLFLAANFFLYITENTDHRMWITLPFLLLDS